MLRIIVFALIVLMTADLCAQQQGFGIVPDKKYLWFGGATEAAEKKSARPVVQAPPFCGKKRRDMGNKLPLPFGVSVIAGREHSPSGQFAC